MKPPRAKESEVQKAIMDALVLAGCEVVLHTSAHRQKGSSGVAKGIPDLLVGHPLAKPAIYGIEVKRNVDAAVSPEQKALADAGWVFICWTPEQALKVIYDLVFAAWMLPARRVDEPHVDFAYRKADWFRARDRFFRTMEAFACKP